VVDPSEKERRKALQRQARDQQRAQARAAQPLNDDQLRELFDALDEQLSSGPCDHTLRLTRQFLDSAGASAETVIPWLVEHGGGCDCEVLANVEEHWLESKGEA
jgi:hypothetical protein